MDAFLRSLRADRWRFRLVVVALVNVVWSFHAELAGGGPLPFGLTATGAVVGVSTLLFTPAFYHALYRDAGGVREIDVDWTPDRRLWVGGGVLLSLVSVALYLNPLTHYVAAAYFVQRYRKLPLEARLAAN